MKTSGSNINLDSTQKKRTDLYNKTVRQLKKIVNAET